MGATLSTLSQALLEKRDYLVKFTLTVWAGQIPAGVIKPVGLWGSVGPCQFLFEVLNGGVHDERHGVHNVPHHCTIHQILKSKNLKR